MMKCEKLVNFERNDIMIEYVSKKLILLFLTILTIVSVSSLIINIYCLTKITDYKNEEINKNKDLKPTQVASIDVTTLPEGIQLIDVYDDGSFIITTLTSE